MQEGFGTLKIFDQFSSNRSLSFNKVFGNRGEIIS